MAHLDLKDYSLAVEFYNHIVLRSPDAGERKSAQRYVAQIYFENLHDYERSVVEYERILKIADTPDERFRFRLNLAKSHFQLNNLDQAATELDALLSQDLQSEQKFEVKNLKANILVSAHRHSDAAGVWESLLLDFPEQAQKANVALNLVVCYEEMKDFGKAIGLLERMREGDPNPEFLDLRISRLRERRDNQPGARGWKK